MKQVFVLGLFMMAFNSQAAKLSFSEELIPLKLGERTIEHSLFSRKDNFELAAGTYLIEVKYKDLYEIDYDSHQTIESEPFVVKVVVDDAEASYAVSMPRAEDISGAKQYVANPFVEISKNQQAAVRVYPLTQKELYTQATNPITVAPAQPNNVQPTNTISAVKPAPKAAHPDAAAMLEFWWQQASPAQRAAFLEKIKGN